MLPANPPVDVKITFPEMNSYVAFILFQAFIYFNPVSADGVLGCGGFVKSDVEINFSLVEVMISVMAEWVGFLGRII